MVTTAEIRTIAERWKRGTRPLKIHDQEYGNRLVKMLEECNGHEITRFDDPLEAATFIILTRMLREQDL